MEFRRANAMPAVTPCDFHASFEFAQTKRSAISTRCRPSRRSGRVELLAVVLFDTGVGKFRRAQFSAGWKIVSFEDERDQVERFAIRQNSIAALEAAPRHAVPDFSEEIFDRILPPILDEFISSQLRAAL